MVFHEGDTSIQFIVNREDAGCGDGTYFSSIQSSIINTLCFNSFSNNLEYPRW